MICLDNDICKGCIFEDGETKSCCKIKDKGKDKECPCIECLLKGMCMNTCPAYSRILDEIMK